MFGKPASNSESGLPEPMRGPEPPRPPASEVEDLLPKVKLSDPEQMKALAHPARLAVWDFLGTRGLEGRDGATATECAEVAGMSPSAMSYHLRTLAKAGFIEEAPSRGDGRERVWRIALHSFSFGADEDSPESVKLAETAASQALADQMERKYARWLAARFEADPEIREAALSTNSRLHLTVEEAAEFKARLFELLEPYHQRARDMIDSDDSQPPPEDSVLWNFSARLFPN